MNQSIKMKPDEQLELINYYKQYEVPHKNPTVNRIFKVGTTTITLYQSGTVLFQGDQALKEASYWKPKITSEIGSDEVGTGDFFGPMIVVAAHVDSNQVEMVEQLGVRDSKALTDEKIIEIANELRQFIIHKPVVLNPTYYNKFYEKIPNIKKILAILHNRALNELTAMKKADKIILDQFVTKDVYFKYLSDQTPVFRDIQFETKAESKFLSVAVASILARYYFLTEWEHMEQEAGRTLLKGASVQVDQLAASILAHEGEEWFKKYAKCNFKTLNKAHDIAKNIVK